MNPARELLPATWLPVFLGWLTSHPISLNYYLRTSIPYEMSLSEVAEILEEYEVNDNSIELEENFENLC